MRTYSLRLAIAIAASVIPSLAWAQHEAHQAGSPQAPSADLTQCLRVQPVIENIITAATGRAEAARLSNSPTEMRAAVESLEAALRDIRGQSAPCSRAAASTDPHAGHTMPSAAPATKTAPAAAKPEGAKPADPHAGHSSVKPGDKQMDPVNGLMVDPATALTTTYQGHTYYFSSEQSRKEFLQNPAKFAKKPKG
jgi:YHS domain-containing protein